MATLVPQDLSFADTAALIIENERVLRATPGEVWAVLCDYPTWPAWFPSVKSVRTTSAAATGVGSTRVVALGGGVKVDERFIAWDEPSLWAFTGVAGPPIWTSLVERVTLEAVGDGTRVTYRMAIEPRRFCGWMKFASSGVARTLGKALENLGTEVDRRRSGAPVPSDQA